MWNLCPVHCVCPAFHQSLWVSDKVGSSFSDYFSQIKTIHKVVLYIANREHRCRSTSLNLIKLLLLIRARAKVFAIKHNLRSPAFEKSHVGYRAFDSTWSLLVPQHEALSFHVGKHHIWQKAAVYNNQCYLYCDHQERSLCWDVGVVKVEVMLLTNKHMSKHFSWFCGAT